MKQLLILITLVLFMVGCSTSDVLVAPERPDYYKTKAEYVIGEGDMLTINVWRHAELSETVPVRPDGRISTPLVGDVQAAGVTPLKLAAELKARLESFIRNPEVTVIVKSPRSIEYIDRVRVVGAVGSPISVPFREGMTVMDIVLQAGGVNVFAAGNKALLHRRLEGGALKQYPIYLDDIFSEGNLKTNYPLQPLDVIAVPERLF